MNISFAIGLSMAKQSEFLVFAGLAYIVDGMRRIIVAAKTERYACTLLIKSGAIRNKQDFQLFGVSTEPVEQYSREFALRKPQTVLCYDQWEYKPMSDVLANYGRTATTRVK
jgi:hypothetical protein